MVASASLVGACTFATKSVSYHTCAANACCFAPGIVGIDVVVAEREAREDVDVQEVVVPCERMEDWSEMKVCTEGGCECSHGRYRCGMVTVAVEGGMADGGGMCCKPVREREELLAEGARVRTGEFTPEAMAETGGCRALPCETTHC